MKRTSWMALFGASLVVTHLNAQAPSPQHAIQLFESGRFAEARAILLPDAERSRDARVPYYLGRIAFEENDYGRAIEWFEHAKQLNSRSAATELWLGNAYAKEGMRATALRQPILGLRAKRAWERAAELDPSNVAARENLMNFYASVPLVLGGSLDRAKAYAREILVLAPYEGGMALAALAEREGNRAEAESAYRGVIAAYPDSIGPADLLAYSLAEGKQFEAAFTFLDTWLRRDPSNAVALYHVGRTAGLSGQRLDVGAAALREFLARSAPRNFRYSQSGPQYWLGRIYEQRQDTTVALEWYRAALEIKPDDENTKRGLARLTGRP